MQEPLDNLNSHGERAVIERLISSLVSSDDTRIPPGDDSAVVSLADSEYELVLTSDPVIEGVHFAPGTNPELIGHKAVGRVLSDLAAMGASPRWILLNIAAPPSTASVTLAAITRAAQALCARFNASIVGGDLAASPVLSINTFACGITPRGKAVSRAGASVGEALYVTGSLGGSYAGKHLSFDPRVNEGVWLGETGLLTSMIDISDGLASDLRHILQACGLGAIIEIAALPLSESLLAADKELAVQQALCDGEDFELLFSVNDANAEAMERSWKDTFDLQLTRIGSLTAQPGVLNARSENGDTVELTDEGFEHFAKDNS